MKLRQLKMSDAPRMLEWMKAPPTDNFFRFDSEQITLKDAQTFIGNAKTDAHQIHLAITNDFDVYMGTVSLKNIDAVNSNAEYAISLHADARGEGYASFATDQILHIAFVHKELHRVYLNVFSDNVRAVRFYQKYGFVYEGESRESLFVRRTYKSLKWYSLIKDDVMLRRPNILSMKVECI